MRGGGGGRRGFQREINLPSPKIGSTYKYDVTYCTLHLHVMALEDSLFRVIALEGPFLRVRAWEGPLLRVMAYKGPLLRVMA